MVISRTPNLYDSGSSPGLRTWAEIYRPQSDSQDFSLGTPVVLPLQIQLSYQYQSRQASKYYAMWNTQPLPLQMTLNSGCHLLFINIWMKDRTYLHVWHVTSDCSPPVKILSMIQLHWFGLLGFNLSLSGESSEIIIKNILVKDINFICSLQGNTLSLMFI